MSKKIVDANGNVYVQKKPFYKKWWFITIIILVVLGYFGGRNSDKKETKSSTAAKSSVVQRSDAKKSSSEISMSSSSANSTGSSTASKSTSKFEPKDSSDKTIESISTYEDYLSMYGFIVNEYISNYEAAVKQYGLGDNPTYASMREEVENSVEEQKKQYGPMKNAKIIGKDDLVQFLKDYRDTLKSYTDQMANGVS